MALVAEQGGAGNPAVGERQLAMVVAAVGDRRRAAADREPGGAVVDQEGRYRRALAPRARLGPGHGEQHHEVGHVGVADEVLGAVDDPVAAVPAGHGRHRPDVRAGAGLGHRQAVDALTADGRQQIRLHLAIPAGLQDVARPGNQRLQRPRRPPQLALGQRHPHGVEAAAAQLGREVRGVQAGRDGLAADLPRQLLRHRVKPFDQVLVRDQFAADEVAHRRGDRALFFAELKVHGLSSPPSAASARRQPAGRRMPMTCPTAAGRGSTACALQISISRPCSSSGIGITRPLAMSTCTSSCSAGGHGLAGGLVKHRVEQVEALRPDVEQLQRDPEPVAERRLAQMVQVRLGGVEGAARGPVSLVDADVPEEGVGGVAHQQQIAGLGHVAVVVDPVRRDRGLVERKRRVDHDAANPQPGAALCSITATCIRIMRR